MYFLEAKNPCLVTKNCSKSSYISAFVCPKFRTIDFTKIFITQKWLVVGSCPTILLNHIFNALSIGVQYTLISMK